MGFIRYRNLISQGNKMSIEQKSVNTSENVNTTDKNYNAINFVKLMKDGFVFKFEDGDNKIECWGSSVSGKEAVLLNGTQVSAFRNLFSRKSLHKFNHDGHVYEVEFNMVSIIKGELHCVLIKDGVHFQTKKACPTNLTNNKPLTIKRALTEGFLFGFLGFMLGYSLSRWSKGDDESTLEVIGAILEPIKFFFS